MGAALLTEVAPRTGGSTEIYTGGQDYLGGTTRLYRAESGGTIREYALADGRPTGRSWTGAPTEIGAGSFVYRGKLYLVSADRLSTFDLGGDGPDGRRRGQGEQPGQRHPPGDAPADLGQPPPDPGAEDGAGADLRGGQGEAEVLAALLDRVAA